ncbi:MAG: hypothetical protein ACRDRU_27385 [Pseudonocardiaceae bacterium]
MIEKEVGNHHEITVTQEPPTQRYPREVWASPGPNRFRQPHISKQGESFVLDLHVTGEFLITFDEQGAKVLRDILIEWLG